MNPIEIIVETTQAIAKDSSDAEAYKRRAEVLCQMQQWDEALKDLDVLIDTLKVEDAELLQMRGGIRLNSGNKAGAIDDIQRAVAINPELLRQFEGVFKRQ